MSTEFRAMYDKGMAAMDAEKARAASEPWPAGVIARYLTRAGQHLNDLSLTVDVVEEDGDIQSARCRGCREGYADYQQRDLAASRWAMLHADACGALPRPGVA